MDGTISGVKANGTNADFNNEAIRTMKNQTKEMDSCQKQKRRICKKLFQISDLHEV
jgi:hypothetical protein